MGPLFGYFRYFFSFFCFSPFSRVGRIYGADLPPSCRTPLTDLKGVCLRPVSRDAFGEGLAACVAATALLARSGSSRGRIFKASPLPPAPSQLLAAGCWLLAAGWRLRGCWLRLLQTPGIQRTCPGGGKTLIPVEGRVPESRGPTQEVGKP